MASRFRQVQRAASPATETARQIADLQRQIKELRAARTAEQTAIGTGGILVQDPAFPAYIKITPHGTFPVTIEEGEPPYYPPGVVFSSGSPDEVAAGMLTVMAQPGEFGAVPVVYLTTPDLGNGTSSMWFQAGTPGGVSPGAILEVGDGQLLVTPSAAYFSFDDGSAVDFSANGGEFSTESQTGLTLSNGWTAAGGSWASPTYQRLVDNTVQLQGSVTPGTLTAGTAIATLPAGYWPPADLEYRVGGGAATSSADLYVHASNGQITIQNVSGTISRISLSAIRFHL